MKSVAVTFLVLMCCGLNAQKGNVGICGWHSGDKIKPSDYQSIKKGRLYGNFSNDNENLYINLRIVDQKVQERILKEGLTIWVNMDGKDVRQLGIRFPMGSLSQGAHRKADHAERNIQTDDNPSDLISLANTIELIGFTYEQERHFPAENRDNFRGSVRFDKEGILDYILIMPIAKLPVRNSKGGHGAMPFTLGIEYGSLSLINKSGVNRGPAPASVFRPGKSGKNAPETFWINNVTLAASK
jgi:hypothetical protein